MNKNVLAVGVIFFLVVSLIPPIVFGYNVRTLNKETFIEDYNFNKFLYPEYYDCYNVDEIPDFIEQPNSDTSTDYSISDSVVRNQNELAQPLDGPMDSPWPMYCHDTHHTGRSPYSTTDNIGFEKWRFGIDSVVGSPVINDDGIIYIGAIDLFAIYPNGTMKWRYDTKGFIESCPAIDENGVIYIGSAITDPGLWAINPNGTSKWKYFVGNHIDSSPVIGNDGIIYFGDWNGNIHALYPNGTRKWIYHTGNVITSSPAIGLDGTIYCGSHDNNLYALYPDNGTMKWSFNTGSWVHGCPTIATDGTVYIGSDNGYLYAFYPNNGTVKWQCSVGYIWGSPAIANDGTIYVGTWGMNFFAVYPNGTIKWTYNSPGRIWFGSSAVISAEGTIYFGTAWMDGGEGAFIALNSDGTERWEKSFGSIESSPAIGSDGTVYIGGKDDGYLYAFGSPDPNAPSAPQINGHTSIKPWRSYEYTFNSTSPLGRNVYYYIDWGDNTFKDWFGPFGSSEEVKVSHTWFKRGTYIIKAHAKDSDDLLGAWGELKVTTPKNKVVNFNSLFLTLVEKFPVLEKLLQLLK